MTSEPKKEKSKSEQALRTLAFATLIGCVIILIYGIQFLSFGMSVSVIGVAFMVAGAALLVGGLLGFLFGIPRTLQRETPTEFEPADGGESSLEAPDQGVSYQVNTNLEQISDWLTKILVGVGLTQIGKIPGALQLFGDYVSVGLGGANNSKTFAVAVLLYFLTCGFLIGYLWTRLHLAGALRRADRSALGVLQGKVERMDSEAEERDEQARDDARALSVARRQLDPGPGSPAVPDEEICTSIERASPPARAQIFYLAREVRRTTWRDSKAKERMERTIPIFRALIASDNEGKYHRNHGQLGFALKDQRRPEWSEAQAALSEAIRRRGAWEAHGWLFYEFNRAICRMKMDEQFHRALPSSSEAKAGILSDLQAASHAEDLRDYIAADETIAEWMDLNKVDPRRLT